MMKQALSSNGRYMKIWSMIPGGMWKMVVSRSVDTSLSLEGERVWLVGVSEIWCSVFENSGLGGDKDLWTRCSSMDIGIAGFAIFAFLWEGFDLCDFEIEIKKIRYFRCMKMKVDVCASILVGVMLFPKHSCDVSRCLKRQSIQAEGAN